MIGSTAILRHAHRFRIVLAFLLSFALLWSLLLPVAAFAGGSNSLLSSICSYAPDRADAVTDPAAADTVSGGCIGCAAGAAVAQLLPTEDPAGTIPLPIAANAACSCVMGQTPRPTEDGTKKQPRGPPQPA